jgi:hypothetical protein
LTSDSNAFARYGAVWFSHFEESITNGGSYYSSVAAQCSAVIDRLNYSVGCSRFNGVGYTVQYNFTALHAALVFESMATEALVRHGTKNPEIRVVTTIAPLPVTKVEENIGAGTDAFLIWFLVSRLMYMKCMTFFMHAPNGSI